MVEHPIDDLESPDKSVDAAELEKVIAEIIAADDQLAAVRPGDFVARQQGMGSDPVTAIALVFVGALATEAAKTLWKEVIWPSLKLRLGDRIRKKA